MEISYKTKNGILVYDYRNKNINSFSLSLFLRFGAMFESDGEVGAAHLFEHAVFRHLNRLYDGRLYKKLDSLGLSLDALTAYNYVEFDLSGASEHFEDAAKILSDIFLPFEFNAAELKPEKDRIKAEILESGETSSLGYFCDKIVWEGGPLSRRISGSAGGIDKIGITKLKEIQKRMLTRENIFVYASGNYTDSGLDTLFKHLEKHTLDKGERLECNVPVPASFGNRPREIHLKNGTYTCVQLCFDIAESSEKLPALYLLGDMLFGGNSSIIHDALSEKNGLIYSFSSYLDVYKNLSEIYLSFDVRSDKLYKSVEEALTAFSRVGELAEEYIRYALPDYTDNAAMLEDSPTKLAAKLVYEAHILGQHYRSAEERKIAFSSVKAEDIKALAEKIFRPQNLTLAVKANKNKIDTDRLRALIGILDK